jgi:hypothetical protein
MAKRSPENKLNETMIRLNIDVTKIDKSLLFKGTKGTYCDITLMDNKDGTDQYGNDGFAVQDVGKEKRVAGIRGPILGNWKHVDTSLRPVQKSMPEAPGPSPAGTENDDDDIPF